jgi:hypothetical protein
MTDVHDLPRITNDLAARFEAFGRRSDITLYDPPPGPLSPLTDDELIRWSRRIPNFEIYSVGERIAELNTRHPWVEDAAWVEFEDSSYYGVSEPGSSALVGNFNYQYYDSLFQELGHHGVVDVHPKAKITLKYAPTGGGNLLTCRVFSVATGPTFPGYFHISGPGGVTSVQNNGGGETVLSYVVPPGGKGPIEIRTDRNAISVWAFRDCVITQL